MGGLFGGNAVIFLGTLVLAVLLPVAVLVSRNHVRLQRAEIIRHLESFFRAEETRTGKWQILPSFEFVKTKYHVAGEGGSDKELALRWYLPAAALLVAMTWMGAWLALLASDGSCFSGRETLSGWTCGGVEAAQPLLLLGAEQLEGAERAAHMRLGLTVMVFAFLGAYLCVARSLVRSVANFDLSPLSFFRGALTILLAVLIAVALWRGGAGAVALLSGESATGAWIVIAFFIGFFPGLPERFMRSVWRRGLLKKVDTAAVEASAVVPLDLLDGIDADARDRLEEFNLDDVQNLATANPIMLFVETPFGIYQSIDWVAQAQLASAVGTTRFIALRRFGIRTIFDLDAAMNPLTPGAAPGLEARVADLLLPPAAEEGEAARRARVADAQALAFIMVDNLATLRLRQIWTVIADRVSTVERRVPRLPVVAPAAE